MTDKISHLQEGFIGIDLGPRSAPLYFPPDRLQSPVYLFMFTSMNMYLNQATPVIKGKTNKDRCVGNRIVYFFLFNILS